MSKFSDADPHDWCKAAVAELPASTSVYKPRSGGHGGKNVTVSFSDFIRAIHKYAGELGLETEIIPSRNNPRRKLLFITGHPRGSRTRAARERVTYQIDLNHAVSQGVGSAASNLF